jgi:NADH-quinone oxidoreductase subunit J
MNKDRPVFIHPSSFILSKERPMDFHSVLFYILAGIVGGSALAVVVTDNIVRAALWLVFTLAGVAGLFFLLGADFVGAAQLLIYVGGTLVLVVFGVMLTAQGPFVNLRISAAEWAIGLGVGLLFYSVLALVLLTVKPERPRQGQLASSVALGEALLGFPEAAASQDADGQPLRVTGGARPGAVRTRVAYLLPFEIVSVHLLVVLIGAAYLARAKRRPGGVP